MKKILAALIIAVAAAASAHMSRAACSVVAIPLAPQLAQPTVNTSAVNPMSDPSFWKYTANESGPTNLVAAVAKR